MLAFNVLGLLQLKQTFFVKRLVSRKYGILKSIDYFVPKCGKSSRLLFVTVFVFCIWYFFAPCRIRILLSFSKFLFMVTAFRKQALYSILETVAFCLIITKQSIRLNSSFLATEGAKFYGKNENSFYRLTWLSLFVVAKKVSLGICSHQTMRCIQYWLIKITTNKSWYRKNS